MNNKITMSAAMPTTAQIAAKAKGILDDASRRMPINRSALRLMVSHETFFDLMHEAKAFLPASLASGELRIWGIKVDRESGIPDIEVELRLLLGRSWA